MIFHTRFFSSGFILEILKSISKLKNSTMNIYTLNPDSTLALCLPHCLRVTWDELKTSRSFIHKYSGECLLRTRTFSSILWISSSHLRKWMRIPYDPLCGLMYNPQISSIVPQMLFIHFFRPGFNQISVYTRLFYLLEPLNHRQVPAPLGLFVAVFQNTDFFEDEIPGVLEKGSCARHFLVISLRFRLKLFPWTYITF